MCACAYACVRVYVCVCLCVNRFSPEPAAVNIKRGDMDSYHGSSVQQDSGGVLSKQKHFPGG